MNNKLEFGTAGIRGVLGSGIGHLNYAHVQRVINGYSKYLLNKYKNQKITIVIGRDNRRMSYSFAKVAAIIFNSYGIVPLFSKEITPTPFVSYLILKHKAQGAVNVTASHNPAEYNGIKLYNDMGSQCLPEEIKEMSKYFEEYQNYSEEYKFHKSLTKQNYSYLEFVSKKDKDEYIDNITNIGGNNYQSKTNISYSPLHGTGNKYIKDIVDVLNQKNTLKDYLTVNLVKEQMIQDRNFSACPYPNPEKKEAYKMLIDLGKKNHSDIILMTDPDSDRVGLGVWHNNEYVLLNGNETATLIFDYLLKTTDLKDKEKMYMTYSFVSSNVPALLAQKAGIKQFFVPTGFKWIGMIINQELKKDNHSLFAFEESYGSLIDESLARDKDALQSVVMLIKMASYYKSQHKNLIEVLDDIYKEVGYVISGNVEITITPEVKLEELQKNFVNLDLANKVVTDYNRFNDYMKSNMIKITFKDNPSWLALRPSGTEPKIKYYIFAFGKDKNEAQKMYKYYKHLITNA